VSDDTGQPLAGAKATIKFLKIGGEDVNSGLTDENGEFNARTAMSLGTYLQAEKVGHYMARLDNLNNFHIPVGRAMMPFTLPRVVDPIALHAVRISSIKLPVQNEWLGFDLAAADWVQPYGKGQVADIRFRFTNEFKGWNYSDEEMRQSRHINKDKSEEEIRAYYGKWRGKLEVSFPNPQDGLIEETERYWYYNELRLPHRAPTSGYQPGKHYETNTYEQRQRDRLVGYFLRTRVKHDERGDIISANYAKIYEEIRFDARGTVSFWYYFNPTPNDRNLEFDPARNLFPRTMTGANIASP